MHWTAFLAYRRFPAHARVMEDCACIQCGYNLRMQMVSSRCPECGYEVGHSVFLLAKPEVAARDLRTAGTTYAAVLAIPLVMLLGATWSFFIASLIATSAALFRVIALSDLRFNGALARLPVIGQRLNVWFLASIVDLLVGAAWLTAMLLTSGNRNMWNSGLAPTLIQWSVIAWLITALVSALVAGRFGFALMDMINFVWTRIEFRVQQWIALAMLLTSPTLMLAPLAVVLSGWPAHIANLLNVLLLCLLMLATGIPLLHAATACEQYAEDWDDLIESERIAVVPESQRPRKPEPPAIPVDGGTG